LKIFISYSTCDKEVALTINYDLKELGIETLFDEERIKEIDNIDKYMKSIKDCDYVISIISINYLQSYYCMSEIAEIKEELEKKLIPIVLNSSQQILKKDPKSLDNYIKFWNNKYKTLLKYNKNNPDAKINSALSQNTTLERELNNYLTIMNLIPKFIYKIQSTRCLDFSTLKKTEYKALINHIRKPKIEFEKLKIFDFLNFYIDTFLNKTIYKKYKISKKNLISFFFISIIILGTFFIKFKNFKENIQIDDLDILSSSPFNISTNDEGSNNSVAIGEITVQPTTTTNNLYTENNQNNINTITNDSASTQSPIPSTTNTSMPSQTQITATLASTPPAEISSQSSKVKLIQASVIENNHVGNDWHIQILINGQPFIDETISDGSQFTSNKVFTVDSDKIDAQITVIENDKNPNNKKEYLSLNKGLKSIKVEVAENLGRYTGNTATWEFKLQID
jgi:hypothetical protein